MLVPVQFCKHKKKQIIILKKYKWLLKKPIKREIIPKRWLLVKPTKTKKRKNEKGKMASSEADQKKKEKKKKGRWLLVKPEDNEEIVFVCTENPKRTL